MGLERLQAGEEGGDSGCAALWRGAYIFHNDYKNSPKNNACTTHCVVHAAGGEGGIRTLAPVTPAYSLSRGAPYSHLGTSPRDAVLLPDGR